jgi:hypothetical protein
MKDISSLAKLKILLIGMEKDFGIDDLNEIQLSIVYAATLISQEAEVIETDAMRKHILLGGISRSTFFRALRGVVDQGYIKHNDGALRSSYTLTGKLK